MIPGSANPLLLKSAAAAGGYQIERSLRFNSSDSGFCSRTPGTASNRKTWTWAGWVKRSALTSSAYSLFAVYADGSNRGYISYQGSTDKILLFSRVGGSDIYEYSTNAVFRDASAWYHVVVAFDTTQATASNRLKIYVNGVEQAITASTTVSQNTDTYYNTTQPHYIGYQGGGDAYYSGYLADIHFIDGQALTPSSFTEVSATTGQLIPLAYSGTFGTNGFWLKFSDNSAATAATLGKDYSGNSNNWTPNNLSVTAGAGNDSLVDTPTSFGTDTGVGGEVRGNYCTWNPLAKNSAITLANGNLDTSNSGGASDGFGLATIAASTGKFYWEVTVNTASAGRPIVGVVPTAAGLVEVGSGNANSVGYRNTGAKRINGSDTSYGNSYTNGDVIGVALDLDNGAIYFSKNGTFQNSGSPTSGSSKTGAAHTWTGGSVEMTPGISEYSSNCSTNWGSRAFAYTAPSGFKALCDTNLGAPLVAKPNTLMDVALYTGTGAAQSITGLAFNPDFVWLKRRSSAQAHYLYDVIRGTSSVLFSDGTDAEQSISTGLTAFNSDGFSLGSLSGVNASSTTNVAWAWDAGTTTASNGSGSITSQVRANVSAGFSVVGFNSGSSGAKTIGHGLGVAPSLLICKNRDGSANWTVYHSSATNVSQFLMLNSTNAVGSSSNIWGSAAPTSTVFGFDSGTNQAANVNIICYAFAPVVGYSSFGSYTGNGSTDGPFVYTGFRPKWILTKRYDGGSNGWGIFDALRPGYNLTDSFLQPQSSGAESTGASAYSIDILSNGFKVKGTDAFVNQSAGTYIYAAFAENPFQYARAR